MEDEEVNMHNDCKSWMQKEEKNAFGELMWVPHEA